MSSSTRERHVPDQAGSAAPAPHGLGTGTGTGTFRVPVRRMLRPTNPLSVAETEELFWGEDLIRYLKDWQANPYK